MANWARGLGEDLGRKVAFNIGRYEGAYVLY